MPFKFQLCVCGIQAVKQTFLGVLWFLSWMQCKVGWFRSRAPLVSHEGTEVAVGWGLHARASGVELLPPGSLARAGMLPTALAGVSMQSVYRPRLRGGWYYFRKGFYLSHAWELNRLFFESCLKQKHRCHIVRIPLLSSETSRIICVSGWEGKGAKQLIAEEWLGECLPWGPKEVWAAELIVPCLTACWWLHGTFEPSPKQGSSRDPQLSSPGTVGQRLALLPRTLSRRVEPSFGYLQSTKWWWPVCRTYLWIWDY